MAEIQGLQVEGDSDPGRKLHHRLQAVPGRAGRSRWRERTGCRCVGVLGHAFLFSKANLSGIQTEIRHSKKKKKSPNSWVLLPDLKWPRVLGRDFPRCPNGAVEVWTSPRQHPASPTPRPTPSGFPPPPAKPHCNQRISVSAQRHLKGPSRPALYCTKSLPRT